MTLVRKLMEEEIGDETPGQQQGKHPGPVLVKLERKVVHDLKRKLICR